MDTKEKAQELLEKFAVGGWRKEHSISCVNEILKIFEGLSKPEYCAFDAIGERNFTFEGEYPDCMTGYDMIEYWEDVKVQIEALP